MWWKGRLPRLPKYEGIKNHFGSFTVRQIGQNIFKVVVNLNVRLRRKQVLNISQIIAQRTAV
jgi:hypothetical protein